MAVLKSSFWLIPTALIPVVCGNPCEVRNPPRTFETGFFETGVMVEPVLELAFEQTTAVCDDADKIWTIETSFLGEVSTASLTLLVRDDTQELRETHPMIVSSSGEQSRVMAELQVDTESVYEPGVLTALPCLSSPQTDLVYVVEVMSAQMSQELCVIVGDLAELYLSEFDQCMVVKQ